AEPEIIRTLEDSPFYMRSEVVTDICGERVHAVHESLDLDRFAHPIVKLMLPFRMPRIR
ncbi:MAG: carotenoid 1,2-hydratase, partial [Pseudomonadota bacterium]